MRLGDGVHGGAGSKIVRVLLAAMQHDDEATWPLRRAGRNVQLVASRPRRAGKRPSHKLCAICNGGRRTTRFGSDGLQACQRSERLGRQPAFPKYPQHVAKRLAKAP